MGRQLKQCCCHSGIYGEPDEAVMEYSAKNIQNYKYSELSLRVQVSYGEADETVVEYSAKKYATIGCKTKDKTKTILN